MGILQSGLKLLSIDHLSQQTRGLNKVIDVLWAKNYNVHSGISEREFQRTYGKLTDHTKSMPIYHLHQSYVTTESKYSPKHRKQELPKLPDDELDKPFFNRSDMDPIELMLSKITGNEPEGWAAAEDYLSVDHLLMNNGDYRTFEPATKKRIRELIYWHFLMTHKREELVGTIMPVYRELRDSTS